MSYFDERIEQDILKLKKLEQITNGKVSIKKITGNPKNHIEIGLNFKTILSKEDLFPKNYTGIVHIDLLSKYPFNNPPKATFVPLIFHPNVYSNGVVCLGPIWRPTEFLDLLVKRLVQIMIFDPLLTNPNSPANIDAANWYRNVIRTRSNLFPTENLTNVFVEKQIKPNITFRKIK
jgi:ubiquitin-protein ligase